MPPVIRASEIGTYLYCRRAWHYHKQGVESANQAAMSAGTELHRRHGRKALSAAILRGIGLVLLLAAILILAAYWAAHL